MQKRFFPVLFNLSAAAVSAAEQGLYVLIGSHGEGLGSRKGRVKRRAIPFPSAILITPNCPALNTGSQMPCRAALHLSRAIQGWCTACSSCCLRAPAGLEEFKPSISIRGYGLARQQHNYWQTQQCEKVASCVCHDIALPDEVVFITLLMRA